LNSDDDDKLEAFDAIGSWCWIERVSVSGKAYTDRQSLSLYGKFVLNGTISLVLYVSIDCV
jgi:hypothetical protein